jgi:hypothetical protein
MSLCCDLGHRYSKGGGETMQSIRAIMREGRIELLDNAEIPEGTEMLITPMSEESFWLNASASTLEAIWNNPEDEVYAELLKE